MKNKIRKIANQDCYIEIYTAPVIKFESINEFNRSFTWLVLLESALRDEIDR
jgi:hypothetical protein